MWFAGSLVDAATGGGLEQRGAVEEQGGAGRGGGGAAGRVADGQGSLRRRGAGHGTAGVVTCRPRADSRGGGCRVPAAGAASCRMRRSPAQSRRERRREERAAAAGAERLNGDASSAVAMLVPRHGERGMRRPGAAATRSSR